MTSNLFENKTYFCGSLGSFFFFFLDAFGLRAGGALGFIVLLFRFGESLPTYGSGDGRLNVVACKDKTKRLTIKFYKCSKKGFPLKKIKKMKSIIFDFFFIVRFLSFAILSNFRSHHGYNIGGKSNLKWQKLS